MKWSFRPSPSLLLAAFALAAAGFAYWASQRYLEQNANSVRQRWERRYAAVPTLVSKRELPAGHVLLADDLAVRSMPAAYLPGRSLGVRDADGAVGRRLIVALHAGDPLTQALLESRSVVTLAHQLQPGARAVTVPVDEVSSQGGLVRPGDRVDLMLTEERQDDGERCVSIRPLLESVRVLATGRATREPGTAAGNPDSGSERWTADSYSTMTLDVTPDQAQQLAAGQRLGDIVPMLRGEGDLAPSGLDPRGSGRGACRTPSVVADASAPSQPALAVDLLVGGRQRLTVTRHWVRESPTEE